MKRTKKTNPYSLRRGEGKGEEDCFCLYWNRTVGFSTQWPAYDPHRYLALSWKACCLQKHHKDLFQLTNAMNQAIVLLITSLFVVSITALKIMKLIYFIQVIHQLLTGNFAAFNFFLCHFSPPLSLCWLIKSECIPLEGEKCHLVVINGSCYNLSHTFSDAGQYCLSVRVENGVTMLQTYHEIKVWPTGELQPA